MIILFATKTSFRVDGEKLEKKKMPDNCATDRNSDSFGEANISVLSQYFGFMPDIF